LHSLINHNEWCATLRALIDVCRARYSPIMLHRKHAGDELGGPLAALFGAGAEAMAHQTDLGEAKGREE
jgi:hypothetical protein